MVRWSVLAIVGAAALFLLGSLLGLLGQALQSIAIGAALIGGAIIAVSLTEFRDRK